MHVFLSIHKISQLKIIILGSDPEPDPVPKFRIRIRPKRSGSDWIQIRDFVITGTLCITKYLIQDEVPARFYNSTYVKEGLLEKKYISFVIFEDIFSLCFNFLKSFM
jgi:hypothetical protein